METNKNTGIHITFVVDDKTYAVPALSLQGIIGNPKITPIINAPEFVIGFFTMNDLLIPILDLRLILKRPNEVHPNKTCVIIVRVAFRGQEKLVGFIVDSLYSLYHIEISEIERLSSYNKTEFIEGVITKEDKIILLLSLEKIINEKNVIYFLNCIWNFEDNVNNTNKNEV